MGKRSNFTRFKRDYYPTPADAVLPLLPHLKPKTKFVEPCAGGRALIGHLEERGHECCDAYDIDSTQDGISRADARTHHYAVGADCFITNPPWDREILHPIIVNLARQKPTWLLIDADWMHTQQSIPYMRLVRRIVSIGRVRWIPNSPFDGKDNCCWYLFDAATNGQALFYGRTA